MFGSSGAVSVAVAAAVIQGGLANNVLCILAGGPPTPGYTRPGGIGDSGLGDAGQFSRPYGPGQGANYEYAAIAKRYEYEYGLTDEDRVSIAVQQRTNAQGNPNAAFYGTPITTEDVLNSRMIADPLRLLECVMPMMGASAVMVSRPEAPAYSPHEPVYLLGASQAIDRAQGFGYAERMTTSPTVQSARRAFEMAGLGPADMDVLSLYILLHDHRDRRARGRRLRPQGPGAAPSSPATTSPSRVTSRSTPTAGSSPSGRPRAG